MSDLRKAAEQVIDAWYNDAEDAEIYTCILELEKCLKKSEPQLCILLNPKEPREDRFN